MTKLDEMKEQIDLYDEIYPIEINIVETLIQIAEAAFELSEMFLPHGAGGKLYVLVDRIQELKRSWKMDDLIWVEDAHDNDGFVKVSTPSKDNPNYYNRAYQISKSVYE